MKSTESRSKATRHEDTALCNFTQPDIEVLTDVYAVLQGVYGEEAQTYFHQYIKLYERYRSLKDAGVNVRGFPASARLKGPFLARLGKIQIAGTSILRPQYIATAYMRQKRLPQSRHKFGRNRVLTQH